MDKEFKVEKNQYTVLDAFRFFFFLLIATFGASILFDIIIAIIASVKGINTDVLYETDTVQVISCVVSPIVLITYYIIYTKVRKIAFKNSFSDGQKISLLPISVAIVLSIIAIFLFTPFMELIEYGFMQLGYNPDPWVRKFVPAFTVVSVVNTVATLCQ